MAESVLVGGGGSGGAVGKLRYVYRFSEVYLTVNGIYLHWAFVYFRFCVLGGKCATP